ncbi:MAG: HipA N-terminal domain-containing protein [Atopobiaceae bacterium]|nr:HipA N-terminal domain-containing protein [Atopobiaceae bacterium]
MRLADTRSGLTVLMESRRVGTLARTREGLVAFQYDEEWLAEGFSINPYSLPLSREVFIPEWQPFDGLFGAFHDSLPDGWGALLLDRMLRREGITPSEVDQLGRLAIVGTSGRGALTYHPLVVTTVASASSADHAPSRTYHAPLSSRSARRAPASADPFSSCLWTVMR